MSQPSSGVPARRRTLAVLAAAGLLVSGVATTSTASAADAPQPQKTNKAKPFRAGTYTVLLKDAPATLYQGGIPGFARTAPVGETQFRPETVAVEEYTTRLARVQNRVADRVGARPFYNYTYTVNGFAAELTGREATALSKRSDVLAVVRDKKYKLDTTNSPEFLGLTGPLGTWNRVGGTEPRRGAGNGSIVGIIDSGINSDHPSFSDEGFGPPPRKWNGVCETGDGDDVGTFSCNDKLIGGRYYLSGFGEDGIDADEPLSPEDVDGHGSHTASTAAGNHGPEAVIDGVNYGVASGMAPAARVAAYKVCWAGVEPGTGGCFSTDSTAAIDDAVADGVDVLNFSISGTQDDFIDPVELALMGAAEAGVFVATSAGNEGPFESSVNHPSPWLTTVAASTHTINEATLHLDNGRSFIGASLIQERLPFTDTVLAVAHPADGVTREDAQLCFPDSLDESAVDGKIVVCDRGVSDRIEKSQVVEEAGGVGMILVNPEPNSLNADNHFVPTIHVQANAYGPIYRFVRSTDPSLSRFNARSPGSTTQIPEVIDFSSRGPSFGAGGDLLKPDVSAPGVDVVAAVAPEGNFGRDWDFYSGTSMASPHIAGLAAVIQDARPNWSPMEMKSAMMTTARGHASDTSVFAGGAGFVKPREFLDPGLVYDSEYEDWVDFLAGQGVVFGNGQPVSDTPLDASNLNLASIAIGDLAGRQVVRRTIRNVDDEIATYRPTVTGLPGINVRVVPNEITIRRNHTARYRVIFTRGDARFERYVEGALTWSDGQHEVRSPVAIRPVGIAAPEEIIEEGNREFTFEVKAGFNGVLVNAVKGLVPGHVTAGTAENTEGADFDPTDERNYRQFFSVSRAVIYPRIQIDPGNRDDDLDLFLTNRAGTELWGVSATGTAEEQMDLQGLPPGNYTIHVQAWAVEGGGEATPTDFEVEAFKVRNSNLGNLEVRPRRVPVDVGETVQLRGSLSGLQRNRPYLGLIRYREVGGRIVGQTVMSVQE